MTEQQSFNDELLNRIARYLIINASFSDSIGLFHGKMGIVIFFYHYACYIKNSIYEEFAGELLEEIYEEVHADVPIGFESGLCGIAWGIEYLEQNKFVEGNTAIILKNIDLFLMEREPKRMIDLSFRHGLAGIGFYVACHTRVEKETQIVLDIDYFERLSAAMTLISKDTDWLSVSVSLPDFLFDEMLVITEESSWRDLPMGIEKGLSGLGLKLMGV